MAINYEKFGAIVRKKRNEMGYSQKDVYSLTGISIETQRLLENGYREPRIITLERLSEIYKTDLLYMIYYCRKDSDLFSDVFLEEMAHYFNERNFDGFIDSLEKLIATIKQEYLDDGHKSKRNMKFIDSLEKIKYLRFEEHRYNSNNTVFFEQLLLLFSKNKLQPLSDKSFYYLEIQVGILLSVLYRQSGSFDKSETILNVLIASLESIERLTLRQLDYLVVAHYNLLYLYHRKDQHLKIIEHVSLLLKRDDLRYKRVYLSELQFRQAIAFYNLNRQNYKHIIANILLSETSSRSSEIYERLVQNYNIRPETFMDMRDVAGFGNFYDDRVDLIWNRH